MNFQIILRRVRVEGSFALIKKLCWGGGGAGVQGPFKTFFRNSPVLESWGFPKMAYCD